MHFLFVPNITILRLFSAIINQMSFTFTKPLSVKQKFFIQICSKKNNICIYNCSTFTNTVSLYKELNSYALYAILAAKEFLTVLSSVITDAKQLTGVRQTIPIDVYLN